MDGFHINIDERRFKTVGSFRRNGIIPLEQAQQLSYWGRNFSAFSQYLCCQEEEICRADSVLPGRNVWRNKN
ncbi:unnamed protein product [Larinioides sclopetarius]|uniref:Uncharacterized protein n=1 Tax=Larinioides sclopetarius TaxID=280406 RepID=A0AAV1Z2F3_9ARAC